MDQYTSDLLARWGLVEYTNIFNDCQKLIALIKDRRPIYDPSTKEHSDWKHLDGLWGEIAREMNSTVVECKLKWTTMRTRYKRNLENMNRPFKRKTQAWNLMKDMSFLYDIISSQERNNTHPYGQILGVLPSLKALQAASRNVELSREPVQIIKPMTLNVHSSMTAQADSTVGNKSSIYSSRGNYTTNKPESITMNRPKSAKLKEPEDANTRFFQSLMPDLNRLTMKRQREFKELVLCNLNRLLDEEEEVEM